MFRCRGFFFLESVESFELWRNTTRMHKMSSTRIRWLSGLTRRQILKIRTAKFLSNVATALELICSIPMRPCLVITSGSVISEFIPQVQRRDNVEELYIYCQNEKFHNNWLNDCEKVRGVYNAFHPLCQQIKSSCNRLGLGQFHLSSSNWNCSTSSSSHELELVNSSVQLELLFNDSNLVYSRCNWAVQKCELNWHRPITDTKRTISTSI